MQQEPQRTQDEKQRRQDAYGCQHGVVQRLEFNALTRQNSRGGIAKCLPPSQDWVDIVRLYHGEKPGSQVKRPRDENESIWLPHCAYLLLSRELLDMFRTGVLLEYDQGAHVLDFVGRNAGGRRANSSNRYVLVVSF